MSSIDFEKTVETCDETFLYLVINQLGGSLFYIRHDLADERIPSTPELEQWLIQTQEWIEFAVGQTTRFGVTRPRDENKTASPEYRTWYRKWDAWWKGLEQEEQDTILSKYRAEAEA